MTTTSNNAGSDVTAVETVSFTLDGAQVQVPKGTLVIRAAEQVGVHIPRFCDHPLLKPAGACRQCLVEVSLPDREGNVRPMPKPQASCTLEASEGMVVQTQATSAVAEKAQHGVMELLLINHPLDCPTCDKGGECPLQNQAMSDGRVETRFDDVKRTFAKPLRISTQILLDRERCIMCQRCTRFSNEIAGDPFIDLQKRGAQKQIGRFDTEVLDYHDTPCGGGQSGQGTKIDLELTERPMGNATEDLSGAPFASYFSGNTIQICPVGALTSAAYRFRARPFDLVSTESIAEHDANGSAIRIDHRRGTVMRRLAGDDPVVNEEWITDKDRFAFRWQNATDRLKTPLVRNPQTGELEPSNWQYAFQAAAEGLAKAKAAKGVGVLPGGRMTLEDHYAYSKFARIALETNDIDGRVRNLSDEETTFLGARVAGSNIDVTLTALEKAPAVLLVDFEAEEEGGIVFLRLRKGTRNAGTKVFSLASHTSNGLKKLGGTLLPAVPGTQAEVLAELLETSDNELLAGTAKALSQPGAIIIVGERLAGVPGGYTAALALAERTGAKLAWIPRRIGERGGVELGVLPNLLPGGRPVDNAKARADVGAVWGVEKLNETPGRNTLEMLAALANQELSGVVVGGIDLIDLPDPQLGLQALANAEFVVSLEVRASDVTELADVVLPVAPPSEKAGHYMNWEGRVRPFQQALDSQAVADHSVLHAVAHQMGYDLGLADSTQVFAEISEFDGWDGERIASPQTAAQGLESLRSGEAIVSSWRLMLDLARGQDGEQFLAGTSKRPVAKISEATAAAVGWTKGQHLALSTETGTIVLPVDVTEMPDHVVWLPMNSSGSQIHRDLGVTHGGTVKIATQEAGQ